MSITTATVRLAAIREAIKAEINRPTPAGTCPDYRGVGGNPLDLCAVFGRSGR